MNWKRYFVIVSVVAVVLFAAIFFGLTCFSYQIINNISSVKADAKRQDQAQIQSLKLTSGDLRAPVSHVSLVKTNANEKDSQSFDDVIEKFEQISLVQSLKEKLDTEQMPSLCEIICDRGEFTANDEKKPVNKLYDYYHREGRKSLSDPQFRLAVEQAAIVAQIFPESIRHLLADIKTFTNSEEKSSEVDKLWLSTRITTAFFREYALMEENFKKHDHYSKALRKIIELRTQCSSTNATQTVRQCQEVLLGYGLPF